MKWYAYVSEYGTRVYANIFTADSKDEVKEMLMTELSDWLPKVKLRSSSKGDNQYITAIHQMDSYWEGIFLKPVICRNCRDEFRTIDKLRYNSGGSSAFCNGVCEVEYREKLDPNSITSWNNGTVYKITHKSSGLFYVGVTTRWLMQRWWEHIKAESGSRFHLFMKEHDVIDFTFEVLEVFKPSEHNPYEKEAYWINKLNAVANGLNTASAHKFKSKEVSMPINIPIESQDVVTEIVVRHK